MCALVGVNHLNTTAFHLQIYRQAEIRIPLSNHSAVRKICIFCCSTNQTPFDFVFIFHASFFKFLCITDSKLSNTNIKTFPQVLGSKLESSIRALLTKPALFQKYFNNSACVTMISLHKYTEIQAKQYRLFTLAALFSKKKHRHIHSRVWHVQHAHTRRNRTSPRHRPAATYWHRWSKWNQK